MKLCLFLCATVAIAVPERTPPTISLSFSALNYADRNCTNHKCDSKATADKNPKESVAQQNNEEVYNSATCEVGASSTNCPLPSCRAFDHHDLHCKDGSTDCDCYVTNPHAVDNQVDSATSQQLKRVHDSSVCTHEFKCDLPYIQPIQLDSEVYTATNQRPESESARETLANEMRQVRSEWVLTYSAEDLSGNKAENVSFTMIFQDTKAPTLKTEFAEDSHTHDLSNNNHFTYSVYSPKTGETTVPSMTKSFAESCTQAGETYDRSATVTSKPCSYTLLHGSLASIDGYENDDVTSNIKVTIIQPDGTKQIENLEKAKLTDANMTIDTQKEGDWTIKYTSHDDAGIFGYEELDNEISQTVTLRISDNIKPEISLNNATLTSDLRCPSGGCDSSHSDLDLECKSDTSQWSEPGATCVDLRESWSGTAYLADHISVENDINSVDLATNGKVIKATNAKNDYTLTYRCDDSANTTYNGRTGPNVNTITRDVTVVDTTVPVLQLLGPHEVQNSAGSHMINAGDDARLENADNSWNNTLPNSIDVQTGFFNPAEFGVGTAKYEETSYDQTDTTKGTFGKCATAGSCNFGFGGNDQAAWKGAKCTDTCETTPTLVATLHHDSCDGKLVVHEEGKYNDGDLRNYQQHHIEYSDELTKYYIKYSCFDGNHDDERKRLAVTDCRTITQVDKTRPIIQILGSDEITLEAAHDKNYVDDGAVCYDQVDGPISQHVEVSGDVVNLSKRGRYTVTYNCKDKAGNAGVPISRTVHVKQTRCPTCTIIGCPDTENTTATNPTFSDQTSSCAKKLKHEASFDYVDAGAQCSDEVDGMLQVETTNPVDVEVVGDYTVTYRACNSMGLCTDGVNDAKDEHGQMIACKVTAQTYERKVEIVDTLKPVISVSYDNKQVAAGIAEDVAAKTGRYRSSVPSNPADTYTQGLARHTVYTHYMAEATSSSGAWVWAAAAAAVAGLALLAHGQRRAASVSVPV